MRWIQIPDRVKVVGRTCDGFGIEKEFQWWPAAAKSKNEREI